MDSLVNLIRRLRLNKTQAAVILCGTYIFLALAANVAAAKVIYFGAMVTDAGILYYLTFTWRDLIHKQFGRKIALTTVWAAGLFNVLAALYFQMVGLLPAESSWAEAGGQTAWAFLFGLQGRIVVASLLSQVIAETIDTEVYHRWVSGWGRNKPQWLRVFVSNAVSIPVDSLLFALIAFYGVVSNQAVTDMILTGIVLKVLVTLGSFWLIYLVPEKPIYVTEDQAD